MKTSLWVLVVTLGCMGLAACAGDTAQPEPTLGITSPQVISQSQSPQSSDLSDYTEQEIWDMYDDGTIETVFPTSISNLQVDPRIYPDHIITKVSFDYFGSKRLGQASVVSPKSYFLIGG